MSYTKIWLHCVWTTKNREPLLNEDIRQTIFQHIQENGTQKNIYIDCINGYLEHAYCLINMQRNQTVMDCLQLLKGEPSFWINKNKISRCKFSWQDDYFAVSIGQSQLSSVRKYIHNQEIHHKKIPFSQEYDEFMKKYGFG